MRYSVSLGENRPLTEEEVLNILSTTEMQIASEEGLKEVWNATKEKILIIFNHHATMVNKIKDYLSKDAFSHLDPDKIVKAVLPKDLDAAMRALETTNDILVKVREGSALKLDEYVGPDLESVGIEYREDGMIHADKFQSGNWGAGKGKNINSPMLFKKTIEECNWNRHADNIARAFVDAVEKMNKSKMLSSIDRHYSDLIRVVNNKQEKVDVKVNKRIAVRQIRNLNAIRNILIKFVFNQLMSVLKAYKEQKIDSE